MEKGLVVLLLCCAGALIAKSMPLEELQQKLLERCSKILARPTLKNGKSFFLPTLYIGKFLSDTPVFKCSLLHSLYELYTDSSSFSRFIDKALCRRAQYAYS